MRNGLEPVQKALRDLGKSLKNLPRDPLPKQVHKLRTSARRVEAIASALPHVKDEGSRLIKAIEPLRKAAGPVRDMDVLQANLRNLSHDSSDDSLFRLIDHLQFIRAESAQELRHRLKRRRKSAQHRLKQFALQAQSALPSNGAGKAAPSRATHLRNGRHHNGLNPTAKHLAHELAHWPPLNEQGIHDFRVKLKELRYTLQLDAKADPDFVAALGSVQRRIGEWHDWQQLAEIAHEFLEPEQDRRLLVRIDETKGEKFARALTAANTLRRQYLNSGLPRVLGS